MFQAEGSRNHLKSWGGLAGRAGFLGHLLAEDVAAFNQLDAESTYDSLVAVKLLPPALLCGRVPAIDLLELTSLSMHGEHEGSALSQRSLASTQAKQEVCLDRWFCGGMIWRHLVAMKMEVELGKCRKVRRRRG